jgi:hypothetical protein
VVVTILAVFLWRPEFGGTIEIQLL